jgi:hypothetical protein
MGESIGQILLNKKIITESQLQTALDRQARDQKKYLGQILSEMGVPQSKIIRALQYSNKRQQMGQILEDMKLITPEQLQAALTEQKRLLNEKIRKPLGAIMVNMRIIDEDSYVNALSAHYSMPIVSLKGFMIAESFQRAIGEQYALRNRIVVVENNPYRTIAAIAEPNLFIFEEIEKGMPSGKGIIFCIAKVSEIELALNMKYDPYITGGYK